MPRGGHREKAGRKSGWVNSETQLIRVPKILSKRLLEIAKHLDQGEEVHLIERNANAIKSENAEPTNDELTGQLGIVFSVDNIDEHEYLPDELTLSALARKLEVNKGTLSRRKKDSKFEMAKWTYARDQKWGWFYNSGTDRFHPIHPSDFDRLIDDDIDVDF
jgi:hypothetical protein